MLTRRLKNHWFSNTRADLLSGITVALALIPEAIAFSIIAGVDPMVGLYASFCIAIVIAIVGGRPAMISAATGAMALLMVNLVKDHGLEYLFAATILTGILQFALGLLKVGRFIAFVPQSVMTGFVNALAILIFMAQLVHFNNAGPLTYGLVAATLVIIYVLPRFTKVIPSPLAAILIISTMVIGLQLNVSTVGDMGTITSTLPFFHLPQIIWNWDTLWIIFPYSFSLALVGLLESLLTATVLDEMTDTPSNKNQEVRGQGIANIITGFFGGMAGCAMIGQSVINVSSGGRTRLSTLTAGAVLLLLIMLLSDLVMQIPMAALVGVMIMVSFGTFDWSSVTRIRKLPVADTAVMLLTVTVVLLTHDLSKGVLAGVALSAMVFSYRIARIRLHATQQHEGEKQYHVNGQLFFGTTSTFLNEFNYQQDPPLVTIDFSQSHIWDQSAVTAVSKVIAKYKQLDKTVKLTGLNKESRSLVERLGLQMASSH